jgi:hypothetical protein
VTSIAPNQKVLVTARSADGAWLQIYVGQVAAERAWAEATKLDLTATPDSLPIAGCTPGETPQPLSPPPTVASSVITTEGPTATPPAGSTNAPQTASPLASPSRTPRPTKTPKPTASPTPVPTAPTGPTITGISVVYPLSPDPQSGRYFVWKPSASCSSILAATIDATVTDPDGIYKVTLHWQPASGTGGSIEMYSEGPDLYEESFNTLDSWGFGVIDYWIEAEDNVHDVTFKHSSSPYILELSACT